MALIMTFRLCSSVDIAFRKGKQEGKAVITTTQLSYPNALNPREKIFRIGNNKKFDVGR
jgi:hypothetical protein